MLPKEDLGEPTHTLVPCWMPKPLNTIFAILGDFQSPNLMTV